MGRPKKEIDEDRVAEMAYDGASNREIAAILGVTEDTIRKRFPAILTKQRARRRLDLRIAQRAAAINGNAALLIWLGKQELGQVDRQVTTHRDEATKQLVIPKRDERYDQPNSPPD